MCPPPPPPKTSYCAGPWNNTIVTVVLFQYEVGGWIINFVVVPLNLCPEKGALAS